MPDLELTIDLADIQADIIDDLTETVKAQEQTIAKMRAMLERLEWRGDNTCPVCYCHRENGHASDCELNKLFKEGK